MRQTSRHFWAASTLNLGLLLAPAAQAGVTVTINGNTARADFALGGTPSDPEYSGTFFLTFKGVSNLSAQNLNISASIIDPNDAALRARLSGGGQVAIAKGFPVMITVHPGTTGGLQFANAVQVALYTKDVSYTSGFFTLTDSQIHIVTSAQPDLR